MPARLTRSKPFRACLDHLEQALLQADPPSVVGLDTAELRRCLEFVASYATVGLAPDASRLISRLLDLVTSIEHGNVRPTSAVLDTLHRSVDCLRALDESSPGTDAAADLEDLLVEVQALSGAAAEPGTALNRVATPAPKTSQRDGPSRSCTALDALLSSLGPLVNAQAGLLHAARAHLTPLSPALERAASLVDDCIRDTAQCLSEMRSACGAAAAAAPELVEVVAVRACASICLVPASAVLGFSMTAHAAAGEPGAQDSASQAPESEGGQAIDLRRWMAASAHGPGGAECSTTPPPLALTVWTGTGQRVWLADELLFQRTVAVQSLETHFRAVPGLSGVAALGEMGVCLLLDTRTGPLTAGAEAAQNGHAMNNS